MILHIVFNRVFNFLTCAIEKPVPQCIPKICEKLSEKELKSYKTYGIMKLRFHKITIEGMIFIKISTRGRYALRFMLDLAQHKGDREYVSLQDVAERQEVSKKYLEQIVPALNKAGMLKANRGYQGGYQLTKSPAEYTVGDVLRVTEGNLACVSCVLPDADECPRGTDCLTRNVWKGLYEAVTNYLDGLTLQEILEQNAAEK